MYNELIIKTNSQAYKIFLQDGVYSSTAPTHRLHKHNYAEVHVIANGDAVFSVGENVYSLKSGNLMIVPGGIFHCCDSKDENTLHAAFQIDYKSTETSVHIMGEDTILSFMRETEKSRFSQDYSKVAVHIALFCDCFCHNEKLLSHPITDYGFLIHEFFSLHYSEDLHLSDLAKFLHLSERQTERLVIKHTGNTFRNELTAIRMSVAKKLLASSQMSLNEISQYVGYKSYVGFWKAMNKHNF